MRGRKRGPRSAHVLLVVPLIIDAISLITWLVVLLLGEKFRPLRQFFFSLAFYDNRGIPFFGENVI